MTGKATAVDLPDAVRSWERLRLVYNGVMLALGVPAGLMLLALYFQLVGPVRFCILAFVFGLAANCCYFLGPIAEVYCGVLLGRRFESTTRVALFMLGLLFSLAVVGGVFVLGLAGWGIVALED